MGARKSCLQTHGETPAHPLPLVCLPDLGHTLSLPEPHFCVREIGVQSCPWTACGQHGDNAGKA
jgi:hypothetical protein